MTEEVKVVETKVARIDRKTLAENIEAAFKKNSLVDVIADTNLENPTGISYEEYRFIHFYKPGTQKDLFQLYITGTSGTFYVRTKVAEFIDPAIEKVPSMKKQKNGEVKVNLYLIKVLIDDVPKVAEKILEACTKSDEAIAKAKTDKEAEKQAKKEEKQAAKKEVTEKAIEEKPKKKAPKKTEAKEKTEKKAANK